MYGLIQSNWEIKEGQFIYKVSIPANTTATITLPNAEGKQVSCNEQAITDLVNGKMSTIGGNLQFELGSGVYQFVYWSLKEPTNGSNI